jgi:hypothetical protein
MELLFPVFLPVTREFVLHEGVEAQERRAQVYAAPGSQAKGSRVKDA